LGENAGRGLHSRKISGKAKLLMSAEVAYNAGETVIMSDREIRNGVLLRRRGLSL